MEEEAGPELFEKLQEEWQRVASNQQSTTQFLKESVKKPVGQELVAFFNKKLDINRFFIEDSDGKKGTDEGMPKVEFGHSGSGPNSGFADNSDPFEDDLEDALCVFKSGDVNSDILEKNENLIMFYIDLENELIFNKPSNGEESK